MARGKPHPQFEQTEEALPTWLRTKHDLLDQLTVARARLRRYRARPNPRNLKRFADEVVDLYSLIQPKIHKIKNKDKYKADFKGIETQTMGVTISEPLQWGKWFMLCLNALEDMGVTRITLQTERWGAELLEGTIMAGEIDDLEPL